MRRLIQQGDWVLLIGLSLLSGCTTGHRTVIDVYLAPDNPSIQLSGQSCISQYPATDFGGGMLATPRQSSADFDAARACLERIPNVRHATFFDESAFGLETQKYGCRAVKDWNHYTFQMITSDRLLVCDQQKLLALPPTAWPGG
jgi:hypothetical protein